MRVQTDFNRKEKTLWSVVNVPVGTVYSWGAMQVSYLRVEGGSVCLSNWDFVPDSHAHFSSEGPRVELALDASLIIKYEG